MRGVTESLPSCWDCKMISTHTPHARRDRQKDYEVKFMKISTHTPHARLDSDSVVFRQMFSDFNSHASCEA